MSHAKSVPIRNKQGSLIDHTTRQVFNKGVALKQLHIEPYYNSWLGVLLSDLNYFGWLHLNH